MSHPSRSLRVVVETDDPALLISDFACFVDAGFDVDVCPGPDGRHPCPVLEGSSCERLARAAVVVNAFRDPATQQAVARAVHATTPRLPMVVEPAPGMEAPLPDGCTTLHPVMSVSGQTDAVRRAAVAASKH